MATTANVTTKFVVTLSVEWCFSNTYICTHFISKVVSLFRVVFNSEVLLFLEVVFISELISIVLRVSSFLPNSA